MRISYDFYINGVNYGPPKSMEDLEIFYNFDGKFVRLLMSGAISLTKNNHGDAYSTIKSAFEANRCVTFDWEIRYTIAYSTPQSLASGKIRGDELEFDHRKREVICQLSSENGLEILEANQTEQYCELPNEDVRLFQYESGGWMENDAGNFITAKMIPLSSFIANMAVNYNASLNVSGPLILSHQNHEHSVAIPAFTAGDLFVMDIESALGSTYHIEVTANGPDTTTTIAEKITKALAHIFGLGTAGYSMTALEAIHRIAEVSSSVGTIYISTDWEITSITLTQNGTDIPVTETQSYQWGLDELYLSGPGLKEEDLCLSWTSIVEFLHRQLAGVFVQDGADVNIDSYANVFGSTPTNSAIEEHTRLKVSKDYLKLQGRFGSEFILENFIESTNSWVWIGGGTTQNINLGLSLGMPGVAVAASGIGSFSGFATYMNTHASSTHTYTLDLQVNTGTGYVTVATRDITIPPGVTHPGVSIAGMFLDQEDNKFCLTAGNTIRMFYSSITDPGLTNIMTVSSYMNLNQGTPCYKRPQLSETSLRQYLYNEFPDLSNCEGNYNKGIDKLYYTGLGFAISQAIEESMYEDTIFVIMTEDDGGGNQVAKKFNRTFYFPDDSDLDTAGCSCLKDTLVQRSFYNIPLQSPHIINQFRHVLPVGIEVQAFDFETTVIGSTYTHTRTSKTVTLPPLHSRIDEVSLEHAPSLEDFLIMISERKININVDGTSKVGLIKELRLPFNRSRKALKAEV